MILNRIFSTYTFRFAIFFVVLQSVSVFLFLGFLYVSFSYDYFNEVHSSITEELDNLDKSYALNGVKGVEDYVREKSSPGSFNKFYYVLVDANYKPLAGNLEFWPSFNNYGDGWLSFEFNILDWDDKGADDFVGRSRDLENGNHLLVARYYNDVLDRVKLVAGTLSQSMLVTILLGILGAGIISANMLKRIDSINKSIQTIMSGDLSERIPVAPRGGDFARLTKNLNIMLDKIELLMAGVRQVSDNIAHDLRTPLTRLRNNLAQLERDKDGPRAEDIIQELISEADSLLATFNALLRIAQVESGNRRSGFATIDVQVLLQDVIEFYEPLAADKNITIIDQLEDSGKMLGDRDLLFQMSANLVDNAIKYTPDGGTITVDLHSERDKLHLTVADTGIGIPYADREKVFNRFFRVESSRGKEPGNGLGLALVRAVVKLHEGDIQLSDNYPGLKVSVTMPLA